MKTRTARADNGVCFQWSAFLLVCRKGTNFKVAKKKGSIAIDAPLRETVLLILSEMACLIQAPTLRHCGLVLLLQSVAHDQGYHVHAEHKNDQHNGCTEL